MFTLMIVYSATIQDPYLVDQVPCCLLCPILPTLITPCSSICSAFSTTHTAMIFIVIVSQVKGNSSYTLPITTLGYYSPNSFLTNSPHMALRVIT